MKANGGNVGNGGNGGNGGIKFKVVIAEYNLIARPA